MFKKILVPLDGSQLSQRALEPALATGKHTGAELLLVRTPVVDTLSFAATEAKHAEARNDALVYLETICKSNEQPDLHIHTRLIEGDAAGAIVDTALSEQYGTDLIVMATHGRTGLKRWVYGSVTVKMLRSVNCSMLVIRPTDAELN